MAHLHSNILIGSKPGSQIYSGFIIGPVMSWDCLIQVKRGKVGGFWGWGEGEGAVTNDIRVNVGASPGNLAEILMSLLSPFNANQMSRQCNKKLPRISFRLQKIARKKNWYFYLWISLQHKQEKGEGVKKADPPRHYLDDVPAVAAAEITPCKFYAC